MNSYELIHRLRRTRRRYPLTATEQALYHELGAICNEEEWPDMFSCSNQELCNALQLTEKTLIAARLALIQAGLLFYKSGQSKRQFSSYSFNTQFEKKETTVKIPANPSANKGTNATANPTANVTVNPPANPSDSIKTKTETETKPKITPPLAVVAKKADKEVSKHWEVLKTKWIDFYKQNFPREPTFNPAAAKNFKSVIDRLEKNSVAEGIEWTEQTALETFEFFLQKAMTHSDWLKRNFLLGNINSQFDAIINSMNDGTTKKQQQPTGSNVSSQSAFAKIDTLFSKTGS
jgi:hypothetical protein